MASKKPTKKSTKKSTKKDVKSDDLKDSMDAFLEKLRNEPNVKILDKAESEALLDGLVTNGCIAIPKGTVLPDGSVVDETWHNPWRISGS